jgi:glycerol dehydrogenase
LSCAHSIQDAFTTIHECHDATLHGERVAFGTLSLLALENLLGLNKGRENEFDDVLNFCKKVGLPVSFKELFVTENAEEKVKGFMGVACTVEPHLYHMPPGTTPELMYDAIMIANKLGSK